MHESKVIETVELEVERGGAIRIGSSVTPNSRSTETLRLSSRKWMDE